MANSQLDQYMLQWYISMLTHLLLHVPEVHLRASNRHLRTCVTTCVHCCSLAAPAMTHVEQALTVAFRGHDYSIPIANSSFTLGELVAAIQVALHVRLADESIKLLGPKNLKGPIHPYSTPSVTLQAAGEGWLALTT